MNNPTKLNTFTQIREFNKAKALILSCALVQRMLPNYLLFCELMQLPHAKVANNLVDVFWEACRNKDLKLNIEAQTLKLEEITPDVDDYDNLGVYAALDFCMACQALLQLIANEDLQGAVVVAKLSQGSVERYIGFSEDTVLTGAILRSHPLMEWEIETLQTLMTMLESNSLSNSEIKQLRQDIVSEGVSNLGIEVNRP